MPRPRFSICVLGLFLGMLSGHPANAQIGSSPFLHQPAERLPVPFRLDSVFMTQGGAGDDDEPIKCGTSALLDLREAARAAKTVLPIGRPELPESFISSDGRFRIHYTTTGDSAVEATRTNGFGVPDYVYETALAAIRSHHLLVDTLGYRPPAGDGGAHGPEYDIYIVNLQQGLYGYTDPEASAPGGIDRYSTYVVVDNNFLASEGYFTHGLDALRVTVAHEYFHAVQFNYRYREEDRYFFETSSVWFEDVAYDEVNDYFGYLRAYFREPFRPLNTQDNRHEYGNGIWLHYLTDRFDVDIVRQIWEQIEDTPSLSATGRILESRASTFSDAIAEFSLWMYFTGYRANPDRYFPEGASYPLVAVDRRQITQPVIADSLRNLAARFFRFDNLSQPQRLAHVSDAQPGRWRFATINGAASNYIVQESIGGAPLCVQPATPADTLAVIVNNTSPPVMPDLQYEYRYSLRVTGGCADSESRLFLPRPNPFLPSAEEKLIVPVQLTESSQVELFIVREDGRRMRRIDLGLRSAGAYEIPWDGRDDDGQVVASGIYIVKVIAGGFQETAKVAVIHR